MPWPCFWLEPTGRVALGLRRYSYSGLSGSSIYDCAAGNHDAFAWRGLTGPERREPCGQHGHDHQAAPAEVSHDDPAWPRSCGRCGRPFAGDDRWQEWEETLYRRADGGGIVILHTGFGAPPGCAIAGPGALWHGWWLPEDWRGPDGIGLICRCPDPARPGEPRAHDWIVDGPSAGGGRWTRTGDPRDPPSLTVSPSIAAGDPAQPGFYHGFLQGGQLTDHIG